MVLKIHIEYQRNFENYLDGAIKDPPKLAEMPTHLQHRLQEEAATVKQVNEPHHMWDDCDNAGVVSGKEFHFTNFDMYLSALITGNKIANSS